MGTKVNPITGDIIFTPDTFRAPEGHSEIKRIYIDKDTGFVVIEYEETT